MNIFFIVNILFVISALSGAVYSYFQFKEQPILAVEFVCGLVLGIFLMNIWIYVKDKNLNKYKRALEKECISSSESSSRVKVLESKIEVLEKALENALKK